MHAGGCGMRLVNPLESAPCKCKGSYCRWDQCMVYGILFMHTAYMPEDCSLGATWLRSCICTACAYTYVCDAAQTTIAPRDKKFTWLQLQEAQALVVHVSCGCKQQLVRKRLHNMRRLCLYAAESSWQVTISKTTRR